MFQKMRRSVLATGILFAGFTLHLAAQVKKEPEKITITADELAKEYCKGNLVDPVKATLEEKKKEARDKKDAIKNADMKYQHKKLELTGKVLDLSRQGSNCFCIETSEGR
jgi:hypothetical protein